MLPSDFLLGAVLVLKLWLLPQCEGRSSSWLQTHHMRNESLAYLFPGWVRDLWVQTAASRGFFPSPSLMQWTIKWYVFLESSGLNHTTFRVHMEKLCGQLLPFRMWLEELGGWLKLLQCWQASLSPTHTRTLAAPKTNRGNPHTALFIALHATGAGHARHLVCWPIGMDNDSSYARKRRQREDSSSKSGPREKKGKKKEKVDQGDHRVCSGQ